MVISVCSKYVDECASRYYGLAIVIDIGSFVCAEDIVEFFLNVCDGLAVSTVR